MIPYFRSLKLTIDCYIVFPSDSSSKLFNKCLTNHPDASLPLYPTPVKHPALNTQSTKRNVLLSFLLFQIFSPPLSSLTQSPFSPLNYQQFHSHPNNPQPLSSLTQSPFCTLNNQLCHSHKNILPTTQLTNPITVLTTELSTVPLNQIFSSPLGSLTQSQFSPLNN